MGLKGQYASGFTARGVNLWERSGSLGLKLFFFNLKIISESQFPIQDGFLINKKKRWQCANYCLFIV